jgi:phosphatidylglycerol:prolipoprotein diacylglycerol transferase
MDFVAPLVPPGLGFVRCGNYIGGELWGKFTNAGWGVIFPRSNLGPYTGFPMDKLRELHASGALDAYARHPTQLYEAVLEGLVMFVVLYSFSRKPRPRYAVSGLFALMYGVFRIAVEFVRMPDIQIGYRFGTNWVTQGMLLSLPLVAIGLLLLWLSRRSPTVAPVPAPLAMAASQ